MTDHDHDLAQRDGIHPDVMEAYMTEPSASEKKCPECGANMVKEYKGVEYPTNPPLKRFRWWCACGYTEDGGAERATGSNERIHRKWKWANEATEPNPKEQGRVTASEEREKIAKYLIRESEEYDAAGLPVTSMELYKVAREIRDGLHRQGKHANGASHEE